MTEEISKEALEAYVPEKESTLKKIVDKLKGDK